MWKHPLHAVVEVPMEETYGFPAYILIVSPIDPLNQLPAHCICGRDQTHRAPHLQMLNGSTAAFVTILVPMCALGAITSCQFQDVTVHKGAALEVSAKQHGMVWGSGDVPGKSWL